MGGMGSPSHLHGTLLPQPIDPIGDDQIAGVQPTRDRGALALDNPDRDRPRHTPDGAILDVRLCHPPAGELLQVLTGGGERSTCAARDSEREPWGGQHVRSAQLGFGRAMTGGRNSSASAASSGSTTRSARMKRWGITRPRATTRPRAGRCRRGCHPWSISGTPKCAWSAAMAASRGRARRCLSPPRWLVNPSRSKKSRMACGPCILPRSPWPGTTSAVVPFIRLPRSLRGAPPAALAPRLTLRTEITMCESFDQLLSHVAGLICYLCPRPRRLVSMDRSRERQQLETVAGKEFVSRHRAAA